MTGEQLFITGVQLLFGLLFTVLGGLILYGGVRNVVVQRRAINAKTGVTGTVTNLDIDRDTSHGTDSRTTYAPVIEYEYHYHGRERTGYRLYPGDTSKGYSSRSEAEAKLEPFEEGDEITLYVDTDDPDHAFVHPTTTPARNVLSAGVGVVFSIVGVGILFASITGL